MPAESTLLTSARTPPPPPGALPRAHAPTRRSGDPRTWHAPTGRAGPHLGGAAAPYAVAPFEALHHQVLPGRLHHPRLHGRGRRRLPGNGARPGGAGAADLRRDARRAAPPTSPRQKRGRWRRSVLAGRGGALRTGARVSPVFLSFPRVAPRGSPRGSVS